jgi:phosphatidylglycerol:prolipoprotein diacylglycerol transferase
MHLELLHFHLLYDRVIYSYGVLVVLGMAVAIAVAARRAPRYGVQPFDELALGLLCACGGVAGAWLLYVLINLHRFLADPSGFLRSPGMVFYGGFLGAAAAATWYVRRYRLPFGAMADAGAPALALGHAVGRVGCFLGGCCYGRPTRSALGVVFTDPRAAATHLCSVAGPIHPVQLYEAAGLVMLSLSLALASRPLRRQPPGTLFAVYILGYALLRLGTEHFRGDSDERVVFFGVLATSQLIALGMIAVALGLLVLLRQRRVAQ